MNKYFIIRTNCPCCNSSKGEVVYSVSYTDSEIVKYLTDFYGKQGGLEFDYLQDATYTLVKCNTCSCTYQKQIPNDFLMEKLYEKWIDPEHIRTAEVDNYPINHSLAYANELANVITHFGVMPGQLDFLDFGMGWGKWCLMAKAMGVNVCGTELSESRIAYANNNGINAISYEKIGNKKFDFINTEQVFEHIPEPLKTLQYLQKSLKPGGIIKISVPDAKNIDGALKRMDWFILKGTKYSLNVVAPLEHINGFKNHSILQMADLADLKPLIMKLRVNFEFSNNAAKSPREIGKFLFRLLQYKYIQKHNTYVFLTNK